MTTNFPNNLDNFTNPTSTAPLSNPSHSQEHTNVNDAIEAIQTKVGINGSTDTQSLEYRLSQLEVEPGTNIDEKLGLESNNILAITGIENSTIIDSFDSNVWTSVFYRIKVIKDSYIYTSTISAVVDGNSVNMSEYDVISNYEGDLAILEFTKNGSIINLLVNPVIYPIEVRFYRTALKK